MRLKVCHVLHRFAIGGLENGVVNLINHMDPARFEHEIIAMTDSTDFAKRIKHPVRIRSMDKQPGKDVGVYWRLYRAFRESRPDIVHTRNLSALEAQLPAACAGVRHRIHGEHGRDMHDLDNQSVRYQRLRKLFSLLVHRYTSVSQELADYLIDDVGISEQRVVRICNGVDTERFYPRSKAEIEQALCEAPFSLANRTLIGAVGRLMPVKDQINLWHAYRKLAQAQPEVAENSALILVGDGPLKARIEEEVEASGLTTSVWLTGARDDIPLLLNCFDMFVLPSLAEGISNTLLEAMASELPVIATRVGGNAELVVDGETGTLVPRADADALAAALGKYLGSPDLRRAHGAAGLARVQRQFSLDVMVGNYQKEYEELINPVRVAPNQHKT